MSIDLSKNLRLSDKVSRLSGVGRARSEKYEKLGISTIYDLLCHFPRGYIDFTSPVNILEAEVGSAAVIHCILSKRLPAANIRRGLTVYKAIMRDLTEGSLGDAEFTVIFYNNRYAFDAIKDDTEYLFYGKVQGGYTRREMNTPQVITPDSELIQPLYHLTEGLTNAMIITNIREALTLTEAEMFDMLPEDIRLENSLSTLGYAFRNIHFPEDERALTLSRRRLAFDELFIMQLGMGMLKKRNRSKTSCKMEGRDISGFIRSLPFEPTGAQSRAIKAVTEDMCGDFPMNRLLQGDVGTGKTLVAAAACCFAAMNGYQSAMMAPTEILAMQHYETMSKFLSPAGLSVCLLTGSLTPKQKKELKERLAAGEFALAVGTHALIQETTEFSQLGLVITDEQHRFGVAQRAALAAKGGNPHKLVMSATPIPRTLALIVYGDLDITVIDEYPKGRLPIETFAVPSKMHERTCDFIKKQLDEGRQGYIVCPAIDDNEADLIAAESYAEDLQKKEFCDYRVGLLHGKLSSAEKDDVMSRFKSGEIQLLVSTTVVEVGVDVPNANIMVIENADHFGLSQLHQLRGRVGRGKHQSYCFLVYTELTEDAKSRLGIMTHTNDGFKISEEDLRLRGPGDFFGKRQHGLPPIKIADMASDMALMSAAQAAARKIGDSDPELEAHPRLKAMVDEMYEKNGENGMN